MLDNLHRDLDHTAILSNAFLIDTIQQQEKLNIDLLDLFADKVTLHLQRSQTITLVKSILYMFLYWSQLGSHKILTQTFP